MDDSGGMQVIILSSVSLLTLSVAAAQDLDSPVEAQRAFTADELRAEVFVSEHQVEIGGTWITYTATAGTLLMQDGEGQPKAPFG